MPQYNATATYSDAALDRKIREAAQSAGLSVSAWLLLLIKRELEGRIHG